MASVLIVDDDPMVCNTLSNVVHRMGHDVTCELSLQGGLERAQSETFDIVLLDVRMPDGNGLTILPTLRETPSSPEVIIITGFGDPDGAELAIKSGAWDYIQKPSSAKAMTLTLGRALQYRQEKKASKPQVVLNTEGIVGNSPQMRDCINLLAQAANSDANVLITGETGTGKELFAYAIHNNSPRADKNFVTVDCAALPQTLVESILFGYERGAFTGADRAQDGLIKQADGGTLFLDEVGELPLSVQSAFLRVLQEHRFRPIGGRKETQCDFRLVVATNRDLDRMVQQGQFRKELLFRLRSFTIDLPPLREHSEDIKELTIYHVGKICERYGTGVKGFSPEFFEALAAYDWPGNVRELVNGVERALAVAQHDPILFPKHLPPHIRVKVARASVSKEAISKGSPGVSGDPPRALSKLQDFREALERQYLQDLMSVTTGNIKEACRISGLSRSRLYALLKKHNVSSTG